jgi:hypothetical protein
LLIQLRFRQVSEFRVFKAFHFFGSIKIYAT